MRGTENVSWFGDKAREAILRWFGHKRDSGVEEDQRGDLWTL